MEGLLGNSQVKDVLLRVQREYLEHAAKTGYIDFDPEVPIAYSKAIEAIETNESYRQTIERLQKEFGVSESNPTITHTAKQAEVQPCSTEEE